MAVAHNVIRLAPTRTPSRPGPRPGTPGVLAGTLASLVRMWRAAATRRTLAGLDDRMLADIGISRAQAAFEADRLPWDTGLR